MPEQKRSIAESLALIKNSVEKLPAAASTLNQATDQLGKSISGLDAILKKFSLGIPTWVPFTEREHPSGEYYYHEDIGYAKIRGRWGVAIRTVEWVSQDERIEQWIFEEAPRLLRVEGIEKIPELLEELLKNADHMTTVIGEKANEVDAYTAGIREILEKPPSPILVPPPGPTVTKTAPKNQAKPPRSVFNTVEGQ